MASLEDMEITKAALTLDLLNDVINILQIFNVFVVYRILHNLAHCTAFLAGKNTLSKSDI